MTADAAEPYGRIGRGYATTRRSDPRIARGIREALGEALGQALPAVCGC
jgi:hypothetical protein